MNEDQHRCYQIYGIRIQSPVALPASFINGPPEVSIHYGQVEFPPFSTTFETGCSVRNTVDGTYLLWENVGKFLVRNGNEVIIEPSTDVKDDVLRLFLIGTTLAILLHQRGLMILHASAVAVDGEAVVFVGDKGYGKSTTAAALYACGHQLLADDIVAIDMSNPAAPLAIPGYPLFKLWPESVEALGWQANNLPRLREDVTKLGQEVSDNFASNPLPLKCIYVLGGGEQPRIHHLNPQAAFLQILRFMYVSRFASEFSDTPTATRNFLNATNLSKQVPARLLLRPQDLSTLPQLAAFIENDLATMSLELVG